MGDPEWCNAHPQYQPLWRTILETVLCLLVFISYIPQYNTIVLQGTHAISSRFILFHGLFSVLTVALRLDHPIFYSAFNCVKGGPYTGWQAFSSLLGFIQAIVQLIAAIILLILYLRYRTPSSPDQPVEHPEPGISSTSLEVAMSTTIIIVLSLSLAFLWFNQHPAFDDDSPQSLGNFIAVYVFGLSAYNSLLLPANIAFVALQFVYQAWTFHELQSRGAVNLASLLLQSASFILLAIAQTLRSWSSIIWPDDSIFDSVGRFVEVMLAFYGTINTHVAYLLTGLGFLALFIICLVDGRAEALGNLRLL